MENFEYTKGWLTFLPIAFLLAIALLVKLGARLSGRNIAFGTAVLIGFGAVAAFAMTVSVYRVFAG